MTMIRPPLAKLALLVVLMAAGCAAGPENPPPSLAAARSAVLDVSLQTASIEAPEAANRAHDKLRAAEAAWRNSDEDLVRWRSEEALATASLAEAQASAARADQAKSDLQKALATLNAQAALGSGPIGQR